jgi:RNA polymerase sigma-B factor
VVKQLRAEDRRVLALRINDELTQKEIAARIGVSQMQVSRILRRIKDELRHRIELEPDRSLHATVIDSGEQVPLPSGRP